MRHNIDSYSFCTATRRNCIVIGTAININPSIACAKSIIILSVIIPHYSICRHLIFSAPRYSHNPWLITNYIFCIWVRIPCNRITGNPTSNKSYFLPVSSRADIYSIPGATSPTALLIVTHGVTGEVPLLLSLPRWGRNII